MNTPRPVVIAALLLSLLLLPAFACANSFPDKLKGTWRASGDLGDNMSWYKEMTLDGDKYEMEGYPPLTASGTIEKVEQTEDGAWKVHLTDYVFHGREEDDTVLEITLAEDGESLELGGNTWHRVERDD